MYTVTVEWDWSAVAAIGQCLGAIGTFAAVWIALANSRRSLVTKVRTTLTTRQSGRVGAIPNVRISYSITNVGSIGTTISSAGIETSSGEDLAIIKDQCMKDLPSYLDVNRTRILTIYEKDLVLSLYHSNILDQDKVKFYFIEDNGKKHIKEYLVTNVSTLMHSMELLPPDS